MPLVSLDELESRLHLVGRGERPPVNFGGNDSPYETLSNKCSGWAEIVWTHTCAHTHTHLQKTETPSPRVSVRTRKMADCVDEDFVFPVRRCWADKDSPAGFAPEQRAMKQSQPGGRTSSLLLLICKVIMCSVWTTSLKLPPLSLPDVIFHHWISPQRISLFFFFFFWIHFHEIYRRSIRCTVAVLVNVESSWQSAPLFFLFLFFLLPLNATFWLYRTFHASRAPTDKSKKEKKKKKESLTEV